MPPAEPAPGRSADETRAVIEAFLKNCRDPALLEPGEPLLPLTAGNHELELRSERLTIQVWDRTHNITRRILAVAETTPARLELTVERFPRRVGKLFLLDMARRAGAEMGRRSGRLVFRERFRLWLRRQFADWTIVDLSTEANLEFSLSPAYPRAYLRQGQHGLAAMACPPEADAGAVLSFGLIWLQYLRERKRRVTVEGIALYLPEGREGSTALRMLCLDSAAARFDLYAYSESDDLARIDPRDHGNLDTHMEICRRPLPQDSEMLQRLASLPGVEQVAKHDGSVSVRVRGLEFASLSGGDLSFGLAERRPCREHHFGELQRLAEELDRVRSPESGWREHQLYRQYPEAWLESLARAQIVTLDASLMPSPVYGQVPAFAGGDRGILDLLAVDHSGRLTVIELKAGSDPHLPLQALDYWIRVKWHLDRGEFRALGYFPGVELRPDPPRLLLVSPSLEFHPTTETILSFFSHAIDVERIGLAVEWRKGLRVMFRLRGAQRPD